MSTKTALKAAKAAIGAKDWEEAKNQAEAVLEQDAQNYFAYLFLGRANDGLSRFEEAAKAYYDATKIKPDDAQAWLGLRGMYEGLKGAKDWEEAKNQAEAVLEQDAQNYFAYLFLGRANDGLSRFEEAAKAYYDATKIKPDDAQAWLGLRGMYEGLKGAKVDENTDVGLELAQIYMNLDDAYKSQSAIDKLVDHARAHGTKTQYARALSTQLPSSPVYSYLEGRLPDPSKTYTRIAEIHETQEASTIKRLIEERRLRIGATLENTTSSVKNEIYAASPLEGIYEEIINWTRDDELRREYEEKLLARAYDTLMVLPSGEKADKREKVMKLAHDMVVIKHPNLLAWTIELEWRSGMEVEAY